MISCPSFSNKLMLGYTTCASSVNVLPPRNPYPELQSMMCCFTAAFVIVITLLVLTPFIIDSDAFKINVDSNKPYDFSNVCADSPGNSRIQPCTLNTISVHSPCCRIHNSFVLCHALLESQGRIQVKQTVPL